MEETLAFGIEKKLSFTQALIPGMVLFTFQQLSSDVRLMLVLSVVANMPYESNSLGDFT